MYCSLSINGYNAVYPLLNRCNEGSAYFEISFYNHDFNYYCLFNKFIIVKMVLNIADMYGMSLQNVLSSC